MANNFTTNNITVIDMGNPFLTDEEILTYCQVVREDVINVCVNQLNQHLYFYFALFLVIIFILAFILGAYWQRLRIKKSLKINPLKSGLKERN